MRRTAEELVAQLRAFAGDNTSDSYIQLLEDVTDSVSEVDLSKYVPLDDYNDSLARLAVAEASAQSMRDKYINRFYRDYDELDNKGFIMSQSEQSTIERDESDVDYEEIFE